VAHLASLSAIQYELGDLCNIQELDFLANDPEKLQQYKESGLVNYSRSHLPVLDLCYNSLERTLRSSGITRDSIRFLVYVSENATRDYCISIKDINRLLLKLGLTKAMPIGVSLSDCANIITGIQVATSLIASNMAENVLMVCSDKPSRLPGKRKMPHEMSVLSDGAASCLICAPGKGEFDITLIDHKNYPLQWDAAQRDKNVYSVEKFKAIVNVSRKSLRENAIRPDSIGKVITGNYMTPIAKMFVEISGFKAEQGFYDNIARFAHTLAGDILINLKDYMDTGMPAGGEKIFFIVDSYSSCGSMLIEKNKAGA